MIKVLPVTKKEHIVKLLELHDAFLDYGVDTPTKLAINVREPLYHMVFVLNEKEPVGFAHYYKISKDIAEIHFCVYKPYRDKSIEIAEEGFNYLRDKGFKQLITFTPKHLRHVRLFALRCGFKPVSQVPTMTQKVL
jgi:hypothetical protein